MPAMKDKSMSVTRKRMRAKAFRNPRNEKTKNAVDKNAKTSPFLLLPDLAKYMILRLMIGDRLIHIVGINGLSYGVCKWTTAGIEKDYTFFQDADNQKNTANFAERMAKSKSKHTNCSHYYPRGPEDETIPVQILQVCRQFYREAHPILWKTNIWSFTRSDIFKKWMGLRNFTQRQLIRKIRLTEDPALSNVPATMSFKFPVLQTIFVDLEIIRFLRVRNGQLADPHIASNLLLMAQEVKIICTDRIVNYPPYAPNLTTPGAWMEAANNVKGYLQELGELVVVHGPKPSRVRQLKAQKVDGDEVDGCGCRRGEGLPAQKKQTRIVPPPRNLPKAGEPGATKV